MNFKSILHLFSFKRSIPESFYELSIKSIIGEDINFSAFKGKKVLLVNVASKCGFTPQYKELEELHKRYKHQLTVIGFPCNNFLWQEPADHAQIAEFCKTNYQVSFILTQKISVIGFNQNPIYTWLTNKKYNRLEDSFVKWNFQKYLVDEQGNLTHIFAPSVSPLDATIINVIEKY